ncbi:MAG: hypothetical protein PHO02_07290 [Candidatus Nanoarchaeia archaeon]|nr:hypothetical protein [Candidatus Nanoarchaeia archaeon]
MRSAIRNILLFVLMYKIITLALDGAMPLSVVIIAASATLLTIWFMLEKAGILG